MTDFVTVTIQRQSKTFLRGCVKENPIRNDLGHLKSLGLEALHSDLYLWKGSTARDTSVFSMRTFSVFLQVGVSAAADGNMNLQTHSAERNEVF